MIRILSFLVITMVFLFAACGTEPSQPAEMDIDILPGDSQPIVSSIDTANMSAADAVVPAPTSRLIAPTVEKKWDLRPEISRAEFKKTEGAELEMLLIRPIYSKVYDLDENDSEVIPQLTEGQRALYFFRKMDDAMTEGGIEYLYQGQLPQHLLTIAQSFREINIPEFANMAEKAAIEHRRLNSVASPDNIEKEDPYMDGFDSRFSKAQPGFYKKLEKYIREHPEEFVRFSD